MNIVILSGRIGQEPDLKYSGGGQAVLKLSLATDEPVKGKDGKWDKRTEWHRLVAFGKQAEGLSKVLHRGRHVSVQGTLRTHEWEKDGVKRWTTEIIVRDMDIGPRREDGGGQSQRGGGGGYDAEDDFGDDDIPFATCNASDLRRLTRERWEVAL